MRRLNQTPCDEAISRSIRVSVLKTSRASSSNAWSSVREAKSESGRPISLGMMLKSRLTVGVKKRILRSRSRKSVATSVLKRTF